MNIHFLHEVFFLRSRFLSNRARTFSKRTLSILTLSIACFLLLSDFASSTTGTPPPSTSTYADYYVSWTSGNDNNPGTFLQPFKTPGRAVDRLKELPDPSGKIVLIRGGVYRYRDQHDNRLYLKDLHGKNGAPIQFRGYPGEEVVLDSFMEPFDPLAVPFSMECGWGGISISDSSHITVENFKVMGRCMCNVEVLNSDFITIRYIDSSRSDKHGLFTGGSFHDLTIECCRFYDHMYGSSASHGVYITGGHWNPELPPVRNVKIRYVECFFNHRHGIQFNGRIKNVVVEECNLHHNLLGGLSVIGVRNARIDHNLIYKNNKQGIILYTYFDTAYWDPNDPQSVAEWKSTHWSIKDVQIDHNTIFMDDVPWYKDEWAIYNPCYHAGIYLADTTGLLPPYNNIEVHQNIIYNHSDMVFNFLNLENVPGTYVAANCFYSATYPEAVAMKYLVEIGVAEYFLPWLWFWNLAGKDPRFIHVTPTKTIDGTYKQIDFSNPAYNYFPDNFQLAPDSPARILKAGAFPNY